MNKTIVFIRHAHRDTEQRHIDNGLSEKGLKQAKRIAQFFDVRFDKMSFEPKELLLVSSPKLRCLQTLKPIEVIARTQIKVSEDLLEAQQGETFDDLTARVSGFLKWWKAEGPALTLICSHGDWLPLAVHQLLGSVVYFKKGGWLELDWHEGQAHLRWYVPSFKHFLR